MGNNVVPKVFHELQIEAVSWTWKASRAPLGKGMLSRSLQIDGLQHQEMGEGLSGLEKAFARPYGFYVRPSEAPGPIHRLISRRNHSLRQVMALTVGA